jgi:hypothetical protein
MGNRARIDQTSSERPATRYGSASAFDPIARQMLVSHVFTDHGRFDDTWAFDIGADRWTRVRTTGDVPIKRCLARATFEPATGRLLLFGGQTDSAPFLGDLWALDVASGGTWTQLAPSDPPAARHLYAATATGADGTWHVLGGNAAAGPSGEPGSVARI